MEDSDHHHQPGALIIGSNDDLLTEILIRLPVTSILRFKSVSKHWRLLLTHTNFTHRYDNMNLSKSLGLFASTRILLLSTYQTRFDGDIYVPFAVENKSTPDFDARLDFYFNRSGVRIVHSSNGLLICRAVQNDDIEYYVFNPTSKQLVFVPSVPENAFSMALAFHQTHCVHYKVVCICELKSHENMFQIQVYSSETRKWRICIESFSARISGFDYPVYCNGAVYWAPDYRSGSKFVCFELDAEQLQMLALPVEMMSYERSIMYFGESRGHLHLIFRTNGEEHILRVNVYEMLTDRSGWFVKYRVQLNGLLRDFPCLVFQYGTMGDFGEIENVYQSDFKVVDVVRGKEEEDTFLVLSSNGKLIRYNVHQKSFKELYDGNNCNLHISCFHRYIDTLSSL